jgi:predicted GIY-YIG superfamily endonuclease
MDEIEQEFLDRERFETALHELVAASGPMLRFGDAQGGHCINRYVDSLRDRYGVDPNLRSLVPSTPPDPIIERFRDIPKGVERVYFLMEGSDVVYVGVTRNLVRRLQAHRQTDYWRDVSDVLYTEFENRLEAEAFEAECICKFSPRFNKSAGTQQGYLYFLKGR